MPRQLEVARLAALGRRAQDIATALDCSVNTVRAHLRAVYERLDLTNRIELLEALTRGLPRARSGGWDGLTYASDPVEVTACPSPRTGSLS